MFRMRMEKRKSDSVFLLFQAGSQKKTTLFWFFDYTYKIIIR